MSRKSLHKLNKKLAVFHCPDKDGHEYWSTDRKKDIMSFPAPFRAVLMGPPGSGKSSFCKNMIMHAEPAFDRIIVCHYLENSTTEYNNLEGEIFNSLPEKDEIDPNEKNLVILGDLDFKHMGKEEKEKLSRLFGVLSSHMNTSVILCSQDPYNIPPIVRRCSNIWVLWKLLDLNSFSQTASKCGLKAADFSKIFRTFNNRHDSLCIDLTNGSPAKMRINGYEVI